MLLEPSDTLLLGIIHSLAVGITAPIAPEGETMDLALVDLGGWAAAAVVPCQPQPTLRIGHDKHNKHNNITT
jgi:hypothetical protein